MKKIKRILLMMLMLVTINVKADTGPPELARFEVIVSNKNGAVCYEDKDDKYVATNKKISYNTVLYLTMKYTDEFYDANTKDDTYCIVNIKDLAIKKDGFSLKDENVTKIESKNALVLASGGLYMRKGPSTLYSKKSLIPEKAIIKLTYKADDFWFYAEYNGNNGWVYGDNKYLAYDENYILYDFTDVTIYSDKKLTKKVGTIPKLTDINNYITFNIYGNDDGHYVNYNGTKGYIKTLPHKLMDKITIDKEVNLYDQNDKVIKKIKPGTYECYISEYPIGDGYKTDSVYIISEKGVVNLDDLSGSEEESKIYYKMSDNPTTLKKTSGFIGEGLFGEKVIKKSNDATPDPSINETEDTDDNLIVDDDPNDLIDYEDANTNAIKKEIEKEEKISNEMIIIIVLSCIVLALTVVVIILLVNKKKKEVITNNENIKQE